MIMIGHPTSRPRFFLWPHLAMPLFVAGHTEAFSLIGRDCRQIAVLIPHLLTTAIRLTHVQLAYFDPQCMPCCVLFACCILISNDFMSPCQLLLLNQQRRTIEP